MTTDENRASLTRALQGRIREGRVEEVRCPQRGGLKIARLRACWV